VVAPKPDPEAGKPGRWPIPSVSSTIALQRTHVATAVTHHCTPLAAIGAYLPASPLELFALINGSSGWPGYAAIDAGSATTSGDAAFTLVTRSAIVGAMAQAGSDHHALRLWYRLVGTASFLSVGAPPTPATLP
jgi:hypothetical protein